MTRLALPFLSPQAIRQVMLEAISYDVDRQYRLEVKCYIRWQLCKDHFPLCSTGTDNKLALSGEEQFKYSHHCFPSTYLLHWIHIPPALPKWYVAELLAVSLQTHITAIYRRGFPFHSKNQHPGEHKDVPDYDSWWQWAPSRHRTAPTRALHLCDRPCPYRSHRLTGSLQLL